MPKKSEAKTGKDLEKKSEKEKITAKEETGKANLGRRPGKAAASETSIAERGQDVAEGKKAKEKKLSQEDFEKKVLQLAEGGLTSEKIGEVLRKEGTHPKEFRKKISHILKEKEKYISPDMKNVEEKLERIKSHYEKNKQDKRAMREKDRIFAQLRKIKAYHKAA